MWDRIVVRPIRESDLEDVYQLSLKAKDGLTSFPKSKKHLALKINKSCQSFSKKVEIPEDEFYFFVMEDVFLKKVIGVCSIFASIGVYDPFYSFSIQSIRKQSWCLQKEINVDILKLNRIRNGGSEIGTLFLDPMYRVKGLGRLLSLSRFAYISRFPHRFKSTIIAEMRGVSDENGSPFWNHVGAHFFKMPFKEADKLSAETKQFVAELLPKYPIYINLLPMEAQVVIGNVHENTKPALNLLLKEGFKNTSLVDVFDAGPKIEIETQLLRFFSEMTLQSSVVFQDKYDDLSLLSLCCNESEFEFMVCFCEIFNKKIAISSSLKSMVKSDLYSIDLIPKMQRS